MRRYICAVLNVNPTLINDNFVNEFVDAFLNGDSAPALRFNQEYDE